MVTTDVSINRGTRSNAYNSRTKILNLYSISKLLMEQASKSTLLEENPFEHTLQ
jgi:hypothetical protein